MWSRGPSWRRPHFRVEVPVPLTGPGSTRGNTMTNSLKAAEGRVRRLIGRTNRSHGTTTWSYELTSEVDNIEVVSGPRIPHAPDPSVLAAVRRRPGRVPVLRGGRDRSLVPARAPHRRRHGDHRRLRRAPASGADARAPKRSAPVTPPRLPPRRTSRGHRPRAASRPSRDTRPRAASGTDSIAPPAGRPSGAAWPLRR